MKSKGNRLPVYNKLIFSILPWSTRSSVNILIDSFASIAEKENRITLKVMREEVILKHGMNCLWNVGRASESGSSFVLMSYQGNPCSNVYNAIIGKGVTFDTGDTGGINLKCSHSMKYMYTRIAGAAYVGIFV